jgi:5-methylcytosine-specific restriction endonuclease McrA
MTRKRNTDQHGQDWDEATKQALWQKGQPIPNFPPEEYRRDVAGFALRYTDFGDVTSMYGWEIDHIFPIALGGNDTLANLQPLHWKNNSDKGDSLTWKGKQ